MWRIKTTTGTVIESIQFINKPMHWHERPVCNERRELWLATNHEDEHGFVIHTKLMPCRRTHCVTLVLAGAKVLGLYNATTGDIPRRWGLVWGYEFNESPAKQSTARRFA